ncbi:MAG: HPP family protein [Thiohalomonadaceae bacterium]
MHLLLERLLGWLGAERIAVSHGERIISAVGGFVALMGVLAISRGMLDAQGAVAMVASMGATAVLIFAVPHGTLSQPWSVLGGHGVSALIGVACAMGIDDALVAAPLAAGLAIAAMHYLRCMHPPGGATALTAVLGGEAVQSLGFQFVLTPVLLNAVVLLAYGVAFNAPFPWRRYPAWLAPRPKAEPREPEGLATADLEWALRQMDSYIDVSEDDLKRLFSLAQQHARAECQDARAVAPGGCYSNGQFGERWQVRKVVSDLGGEAGGRVVYRVVAGEGRGDSGVCTREEFARWARYEVVRNENSWQRAAAV